MGHAASKPDPNAKFRVIGAGLSRTATTSFGAALSELLGGPCYHGGTQLLCSDESVIKRWIEVFRKTPICNEQDKQFVHSEIKALMDGFVGCTDLPGNACVEELLEIHPDAIVICTVRDPEKWWDSIRPIVEKANFTLLFWILLPVPRFRWFRTYHDALDNGNFGHHHFLPSEEKKPSRKTWDRHIEYLKRVVPQDRLFFYDVRDGWEPLCNMLNVPVPKDKPFPRLNDTVAVDGIMKSGVRQGIMTWVGIGIAMSGFLYTGLRMGSTWTEMGITAATGFYIGQQVPTVLQMIARNRVGTR